MARARTRLVICLRNEDCVDLEVRKLYAVVPDAAAAKDGYLRVIDESGEDYLYPANFFTSVELPIAARRLLEQQLRA